MEWARHVKYTRTSSANRAVLYSPTITTPCILPFCLISQYKGSMKSANRRGLMGQPWRQTCCNSEDPEREQFICNLAIGLLQRALIVRRKVLWNWDLCRVLYRNDQMTQMSQRLHLRPDQIWLLRSAPDVSDELCGMYALS